MILSRHLALFLLAMNASSIDASQFCLQNSPFSRLYSCMRRTIEPIQHVFSNRYVQAGICLAGAGVLAYTIYSMKQKINSLENQRNNYRSEMLAADLHDIHSSRLSQMTSHTPQPNNTIPLASAQLYDPFTPLVSSNLDNTLTRPTTPTPTPTIKPNIIKQPALALPAISPSSLSHQVEADQKLKNAEENSHNKKKVGQIDTQTPQKETYSTTKEQIQRMQIPKKLMLSYLKSKGISKEDLGKFSKITPHLNLIVSFLQHPIMEIPESLLFNRLYSIRSLVLIDDNTFALNTWMFGQDYLIYTYDISSNTCRAVPQPGVAANICLDKQLLILAKDRYASRSLYTCDPTTLMLNKIDADGVKVHSLHTLIYHGKYLFNTCKDTDFLTSEETGLCLPRRNPLPVTLPNGDIIKVLSDTQSNTLTLFHNGQNHSAINLTKENSLLENCVITSRDNHVIAATRRSREWQYENERDFEGHILRDNQYVHKYEGSGQCKKANVCEYTYSIFKYNAQSPEAYKQCAQNPPIITGSGMIKAIALLSDQKTLATIIQIKKAHEEACTYYLKLFNIEQPKNTPIRSIFLPHKKTENTHAMLLALAKNKLVCGLDVGVKLSLFDFGNIGK